MERTIILIVCICFTCGVEFSKFDVKDESWTELIDNLIKTPISASTNFKSITALFTKTHLYVGVQTAYCREYKMYAHKYSLLSF